jgi:hypothetical protein
VTQGRLCDLRSPWQERLWYDRCCTPHCFNYDLTVNAPGRLCSDWNVTRRMRPFLIEGKLIHQVGMPWQWGYEGLTTGDIVNELTSLIADPNVSMHEGKAFVCNVEKA